MSSKLILHGNAEDRSIWIQKLQESLVKEDSEMQEAIAQEEVDHQTRVTAIQESYQNSPLRKLVSALSQAQEEVIEDGQL